MNTHPKFPFLGSSPLTKAAQHYFVLLAGIRALTGKLPRISKAPKLFGQRKVLFMELSEKGYILGTPVRYSLNFNKIKAAGLAQAVADTPSSPASAVSLAPSLMTLLKTFNDGHARIKKAKARNNEKSLSLLRSLVRKYDARLVFAAIGPFFQSKVAVTAKGPMSIQDFYGWADRQLKSQVSKK